ncbi:YhcH/YjgK/YiaL family protein [Enterobacillus tribolii]|uniref:Biofilm protein TabA n=1 Tax=Enterobacillus tribolii TaxID=1487935 RepID=A0A370R433_9GAMM|nr:YhcH/YjgK/YiaL family protein [Enterobacillus tribolii]MBW7985095.1 DUF386 family protein [Enterobacillus tribolii]RDK97183.1 biofilm protein TabA [Enterobacillus tribolii]
MLYGNIERLALLPYVNNIIKTLINEAIDVSKSKGFGKYELSLPGTFLILSEGETDLPSNRRAEVHKEYVDIQILLDGQEKIGYSNEFDDEIKKSERFPNDIMFLDLVVNEQFVTLVPGDFALFYPHQIHRPLCTHGEPAVVKKAIVKIPASTFSELTSLDQVKE